MIEFDNPVLDKITRKWFCASTERDHIDSDYFYLVSEDIYIQNLPILVTKVKDIQPMFFDTEADAYAKLSEYYAYHGHPWNPPAGMNIGNTPAINVGSRELEL